MNLSPENKQYGDQEGLAGMLYDCSPKGFRDEVTPEEMNALSVYYFVGREIDVDNIYEYREQVLKNNPELVDLAKSALRKVALAYRVDSGEIEKLLS